MASSTYEVQRRGGKGKSGGRLRDTDALEEVVAAMAHDTLLLLGGNGKAYSLKAYKVPEGSRTAAGTALVQVRGRRRERWWGLDGRSRGE